MPCDYWVETYEEDPFIWTIQMLELLILEGLVWALFMLILRVIDTKIIDVLRPIW